MTFKGSIVSADLQQIYLLRFGYLLKATYALRFKLRETFAEFEALF